MIPPPCLPNSTLQSADALAVGCFDLLNVTTAIPSLSSFADFRVWGMPVEERRKPIHGGLAAARIRQPSADDDHRQTVARFFPCGADRIGIAARTRRDRRRSKYRPNRYSGEDRQIPQSLFERQPRDAGFDHSVGR